MNPSLLDSMAVLLSVCTWVAAGFGVDLSSVRRLMSNRRALAAIIGMNLIGIPLLAAALFLLFPASVRSGLGLGLLICLLAVGGSSGLQFTILLGGRIERAIVLILSVSAGSVITLPVVLPWMMTWLGFPTIDLDGLSQHILTSLLLFQLLPTLASLLVRPLLTADRQTLVMNWSIRLANFCLVLLLVGLLITKWQAFASVQWPILVLFTLAIGLTFLVPLIMPSSDPQDRIADVCVFVCHNLTGALVLVRGERFGGEATNGILLYGFLMYLGLGLLALQRRWQRPAKSN